MKLSTLTKSVVVGAVLCSAPMFAQEAESLKPEAALAESEKRGYWDDITYGDPSAPVELIEYASLTCSHCSHFALDIYPQLKEKYLDTGKVKLRFRNFILNQLDFAITVVSRCIDENFARKYTHTVLSKQADWMTAKQRGSDPILELEAMATIDGLPMGEFEKCLENKPLAEHLRSKREGWAKNEKISHTPTITLDGVELSPPTWIKLETAIEMKLESLK